MMEPERFTAMSSPPLRGLALPQEVLSTIYSGAHDAVIDAWWRAH